MPKNVSSALALFRQQSVDLDSDVVGTARRSRNFLIAQIESIAESDDTFPELLGESMKFGSFARGTKVIELDDIDLMIMMRGYNGSEVGTFDPYTFRVLIEDATAPIYSLRGADGYINSTRVLNKFKAELAKVPNYRQADVHKKMQAVTLRLTSYPWAFDIVPAFPVAQAGTADTIHYVIPDGKGQWIQTDPRRDKEFLDRVREKHPDVLLPLLRLLKYWNVKGSQPRLDSYHFETIALNVLDGYDAGAIEYLQMGLYVFFQSAAAHVANACPDPKGLGPNLDAGLDWYTRQKVKEAIESDAYWVDKAVRHELDGNHEKAIGCWRAVFGSEFPTYG